MECLAVFLALLLVAVVLVVFVAVVAKSAGRPNAYRVLAQRYRGTYRRGGLLVPQPTVRFNYGTNAVRAMVCGTSDRTGTYTEVHIDWPEPSFRCLIVPAFIAHAVRPKRGLERVELALEQFDRQYVMWCNDAAEAKTFLSDGVQWQIERLRYYLDNHDVRISIDRGWLVVRKPPRLRKYEPLHELVRLALELYDQAMLTRSVGIEFMHASLAQPLLEAICQVCGEEISMDMVFCRRCKTPHHVECWQYYGACSTYGCQETHYVAPRMAEPWPETHRVTKPK